MTGAVVTFTLPVIAMSLPWSIDDNRESGANGCRNPRSKNDLTRDIALAKAWIVSEVITLLHQRQKADFPRFQHWYRGYLPDWLKQIETVI